MDDSEFDPITPKEAFDTFRTFVAQFDPIELLSQLSLTFLFIREGFHGEDSDAQHWSRWIQFTAGYLATVSPTEDRTIRVFDSSCVTEFETLIKQYFNSVPLALMRNHSGPNPRTPAESLLLSAKIYSLYVRGDCYPHQFFEYALELYGQHNDWFRSHLGFTIREAVQIARSIPDELVRRVNQSAEYARANAHQEAEKFLNTEWAQSLTRAELDNWAAVYLHFSVAKSLLRLSLDELSTISGVSPEICNAFMERMSQSFGYRNSEFPDTFADGEAAPWDYNTVDERPFLRQNGHYWLFTWSMVTSVLFYTFYFDLMRDNLYRPHFEKTRGEFVEREVAQYMTRVFPGQMILVNPSYPNGDELADVAVLHDGKILIFQCKAKGLTRASKIGADFGKLRADVQAAIRYAFDQAVRARSFIRSSQNPALMAGGITWRIDGNAITDIYLINVTLMPLQTFATRFENIEDALGLFPEREYPLSMSLGDLDIVTELLNSPAALLHYINRRLAIEKTAFDVSADEIDLLGFYLTQGMYFTSNEFSDISDLALSGFSDEIDAYVHQKYAEHKEAVRPAAPLPDGFAELVAGIESLSNMYRTDCAIGLLDLGGPGRAKFVEMLEKTKSATRSDGKGHSFSMGSPELSAGFSFIVAVGEQTDEAIFEQAMAFAMLKKYAEKCDRWFALGWHRDSKRLIDIAIGINFPWERDDMMERATAEYLQPGTRIDLRQSPPE